MKQSIGQVALVVRDYDEAIDVYVNRLGFPLVEDTPIEAQNKRWVVMAPPVSSESRLLFARAVGEEQESRIGNQTGGRVFSSSTRTTSGESSEHIRQQVSYLFDHLGKRATGRSQSSRTSTEIFGTYCS